MYRVSLFLRDWYVPSTYGRKYPKLTQEHGNHGHVETWYRSKLITPVDNAPRTIRAVYTLPVSLCSR